MSIKKPDFILTNPFPEEFIKAWNYWKIYKKEQFNFSYKPIGEQYAIDDLYELSEGNDNTAKLIIKQSISKGWRGLFALPPIKINGNGTKQATDSTAARQSLNDLYNQRFGQGK